jgi:hypothetical protein
MLVNFNLEDNYHEYNYIKPKWRPKSSKGKSIDSHNNGSFHNWRFSYTIYNPKWNPKYSCHGSKLKSSQLHIWYSNFFLKSHILTTTRFSNCLLFGGPIPKMMNGDSILEYWINLVCSAIWSIYNIFTTQLISFFNPSIRLYISHAQGFTIWHIAIHITE